MPPSPPGPPGGYPPQPPGPPPGYPPQPPGPPGPPGGGWGQQPPPGGGWGQQPPPPGPPGGQWGQPAPKRTNPLIFVAIGVVALIVVGAGAFVLLSGDDGQRDEYVEALTEGYVAGQAEQPENSLRKDLNEEDLHCTAEVMVDTMGVDRLEDHYTPDELRTEASDPDFELLEGENPTEEEAGQLVDGLEQCWGIFDKQRELVRTQQESDPRIPEEFTNCTMDALDDEFLREVTIDDFTEAPGTDTRTATSERIQTECAHLLQGP